MFSTDIIKGQVSLLGCFHRYILHKDGQKYKRCLPLKISTVQTYIQDKPDRELTKMFVKNVTIWVLSSISTLVFVWVAYIRVSCYYIYSIKKWELLTRVGNKCYFNTIITFYWKSKNTLETINLLLLNPSRKFY